MPDKVSVPEPVVFVVDDDPDVRDSLRFLFESVGLRVETFATPVTLFDQLTPERPGCLVLDVRMPQMGGLELMAAIRRRGCDHPVVFLSAHASVPVAVRALQAGAAEFLEKPVNDEVLIGHVQRAVVRDLDRRRQRAQHVQVTERYAGLSERERQVLDRVVKGEPNKVIAAALGVSAKTVEAHRARVMEKMDAESLAALVSLAIRYGLGKNPWDRREIPDLPSGPEPTS